MENSCPLPDTVQPSDEDKFDPKEEEKHPDAHSAISGPKFQP